MIDFEKSPKVARLADANDKVYLLFELIYETVAHQHWMKYNIYIYLPRIK
jgi:hypothetical protein